MAKSASTKKPAAKTAATAAKPTLKTAKPKPAPARAKTALTKPKAPAAKPKPAPSSVSGTANPGAVAAPIKIPAASSKPVAAAKSAVVPKEKIKKPKLVRDSFTMPEAEYAVLGAVKKACLKAGFDVKKSELLRVGVALIQDIELAKLQAVLAKLPPLKAGRPKKEK